MRVGVERGIVAIVAAQVLEDVGEMVSMSWAAVPNDRDRREATTIRRMQAFPLQPLTGEHFVERRRSWSEVPSGLVGCDVHKEIYFVPFRIRAPLALRKGQALACWPWPSQVLRRCADSYSEPETVAHPEKLQCWLCNYQLDHPVQRDSAVTRMSLLLHWIFIIGALHAARGWGLEIMIGGHATC